MNGRMFLQVAKRLILRSTEEDWRTAAGRAYYALFLEARTSLSRWGFVPVPRDPIHSFVRLRFSNAQDADLKHIGNVLSALGKLRNEADYEIAKRGLFVSSAAVKTAVQNADAAIAKLDQIEGDAQRRNAAVAAIRAAWP